MAGMNIAAAMLVATCIKTSRTLPPTEKEKVESSAGA